MSRDTQLAHGGMRERASSVVTIALSVPAFFSLNRRGPDRRCQKFRLEICVMGTGEFDG
jgi:hypothetical protein